ncbi:uncharacterized protein MELLADRAFT_123994 [Melampsora larici-populina 98AG31]|uniref:Secreted protein n=1 Tax=Melampsora larici-populina (strain 98AG31 / pathotype 3-4-7) TaxID=747676 RepID=F4RR91_MELLP|nr:uncharacterized protein MELLADRAFT_123994 [Melampsora larici-populina 98AG31]EGG05193.1 secreted protein [Melampsora larici-populina 98AG31]
MHFTLPLLSLLCVFQAVVALPTRSSSLDPPAILTRRAGTEEVVADGSIKEKAIQQKCFGGINNVFSGGMPFTSSYYNSLMYTNGFAGLCNSYFGSGYQWGNCGSYFGCPNAVNRFYNSYLSGFNGLYGPSIYTLNEQDLKSDTNAV